MIYNNIIIQNNVWEKLNNYLIKQKLPHAFLFFGEDGSGKEAHAIEFSALINCLDVNDNQSCGNCMSCKKIKTFQHGNIKLIHPMPRGKINSPLDSPYKSLSKSDLIDYNKQLLKKSEDAYYKIEIPKANSILINSIRSLKKDLLLSSVEQGWNIILILEAEKLCYPNNTTANALLKILEEPPENTLFILITSYYSKIIDTIKSRCQEIYFPPLTISQIYESINSDLSKQDKLIISNISNGNIQLIKKLETSLDNIYSNLKIFINSCYNQNYEYDNTIIEKINSCKYSNNYELLFFFRTMMMYFKDLFVFSKTGEIKYVIYKNLEKHYYKITNYYNHANWNQCINIMENGLDNIYRNGSIPLLVNGMLIEIRESISNYKNKKNPFSINEWLEIE